MSKNFRKEKDCLNCGNFVEDKFCGKCGQENVQIKESIWAFIMHGFGHYFHYDSKFRKTLRPFLTKPGQLTLDYIEGRRARFIPPISLYLFVTIIYFLISPLLETDKQKNSSPNVTISDTLYSGSTGRYLKEKKLIDSISDHFEQLSFEEQIQEIKRLRVENNTPAVDSAERALETHILNTLERVNIQRSDSTLESYRNRQASLPQAERDQKTVRFWKEKKISFKEKNGTDFDLIKEVAKFFPKLLFILMPLFALFLKWNFRKNKKFYLEHLIYTIHLFSFAFFILLIKYLINFVLPKSFDGIIALIFFSVLIWYTYRSIRVVYQRSRWVTVRKLFSVALLFNIAFSLTYLLGSILILLLV